MFFFNLINKSLSY